MISVVCRALALAGVLAMLSPQPAQASIAEMLERFYVDLDGDQWLRNDGWLEPGVMPCDWYGVNCWGNGMLESLVLPGNNLHGELTDGEILMRARKVDLADNRITGTLPDVQVENGFMGGGWLWYLDLSGNQLEGPVPDNWKDLRLLVLDLSRNRLEGMPEAAFLAMDSPMGGAHLNLADNRFVGELPAWITDLTLVEHNQGVWGGGLNLCWNELLRPMGPDGEDPVGDWIRHHHVGGDNADDCTFRQRTAITPDISGSWYDPARSGEGLVIHLLDQGQPLVYWFTYDEHGDQRWLFHLGRAAGPALHWRELVTTRGRFSSGHAGVEGPGIELNGMLRFDRTGPGSAHVERVFHEWNLEASCPAIYPPVPTCGVTSHSERLEHIQLTRLAGTTCDNLHDAQWMSGAWRSVEASGEGFIIEVMSEGFVVVYWFTYRPDDSGEQAWMTGVGEFLTDGSVRVDLVQPAGEWENGVFDAARVVNRPWGSLRLELNEHGRGEARWESVRADFGAGGYAIQRIARPMLVECQD